MPVNSTSKASSNSTLSSAIGATTNVRLVVPEEHQLDVAHRDVIVVKHLGSLLSDVDRKTDVAVSTGLESVTVKVRGPPSSNPVTLLIAKRAACRRW